MRAKKKLTKLWSILLTLVMVVGMLPTTALATEPATTTANFDADPVGALNLLNAAKTDGAADSEWNNTTKTLTLNGVNFTATAATAVYLPAGSTIVLNGDNTITGGNASSGASYGIYAEGNLTISGSGTLTVTAGTAGGKGSNDRSCGIYTGNDLTMSSGIVKAYAGTSAKASLGIYSKGNFTISGTADVTAIGGTATGDGSFGIDAEGEVIISGGKVTAIGGTGRGSDGLYSGSSKVTINGGTVMAIGGAVPSEGWSVGIYAYNPYHASGGEGTIINGGTVTSATNDNSSDGHTFKGNVTASGFKTISFNKNSGLGKMIAYTKDGSYTLPANGFTAPADKQFKGWKVGDEIKAVGDPIDVSGSIPTIEAQWEDAEYTVNVTNGTASVSKATAGTTVTLTAAEISGKVFDKWVAESGNVTFANANSATTTFTMPAGDVRVKATYKDKTYAVSVTYGTASPSGPQAAGTSVTITANDAPVGKQFKEWNGADGLTFTSGSKTSATATFTMPNKAVTLIATYENIPVATYTVTFEANGGSVTPTTATTAADGKLTSLPTPTRSGYTFNGWYTEDGAKVDTAYVFGTDTTIYAQWTSIPIPTPIPTPIYTPPTYKVESAVSKDADGSVSVSKTSAKKGDTVTITVTPDRYYKTSGVIVKDALGNQIAVTDNGNGTFTFKMPDSKVTVEPVFSWDNPFVDVAGDAYYAPAVEWALKNEVTDGTSATTFSPDAGCTRAQIVTFLWRAAGCPEPKSSVNPFTDVEEGAYYSKAVLWAVENGITDGTGDGTTFSPDLTCTRDQTVTFLWRAEKSPAVGTANPFTDVEADAYYAGATNWAVANGVTDGTGDGTTFSPADDCTRAQIVTFLYRFFVK